jgi:hypothetical protein
MDPQREYQRTLLSLLVAADDALDLPNGQGRDDALRQAAREATAESAFQEAARDLTFELEAELAMSPACRATQDALVARGADSRTESLPSDVRRHLRTCKVCQTFWTGLQMELDESALTDSFQKTVQEYFAARVIAFRDMAAFDAGVRPPASTRRDSSVDAETGVGAAPVPEEAGLPTFVVRHAEDTDRGVELAIVGVLKGERYQVEAELHRLGGRPRGPESRLRRGWQIFARLDDQVLEGDFNEFGIWTLRRRLTVDELAVLTLSYQLQPGSSAETASVGGDESA